MSGDRSGRAAGGARMRRACPRRWPTLPASPPRRMSEGARTDWRTLLEKELQIARRVQADIPALNQREAEQAVVAVFLHSQPIGHKANTPELVRMIGAAHRTPSTWRRRSGAGAISPGSWTTPIWWTTTPREAYPSPGASAIVPT